LSGLKEATAKHTEEANLKISPGCL